MPSPQVGFNNNVKHRGRIFHIQTEDSGVARPHITTHLFADGGLILKSCRTEYSDLLEQPDMVSLLRKRMKDQHKAMFIDLREGKLDPVIDEILGGPRDKTIQAIRESTAPKSRKARSQPPGRRSSRAPARSRAPAAASVSGLTAAVVPTPAAPPGTPARATSIPAGEASPSSLFSQTPGSGRYGATRPSASFNAPDASSIFGGSSISEQSLDDVILSYISADLDGNVNTGE